jgi:glutamate carboxypeptidase
MRTSSEITAAEAAHEAAGWLNPRRHDLLALVRELVNRDSPSGDLPALASLASFLRSRMGHIVREETVLATEHGDHLVLRFGPAQGRGPLVLCHYDTVWPVGTVAERPFAMADGVLTGPGVFDMKASIAMAVFALRAVDRLWGFRGPVTFSLTPDEEIGNPSSRAALAELAADASIVLVLEPPLPGGLLKTRRKGIANARVSVTGKAAHAGLDPDAGASAALEAAHLALAAADLADAEQGTTVNVGVLRAGERRNVVPAEGTLDIDVRAWDDAELRRVLDALAATAPAIAGTTIAVEGRVHRPPMVRDPRIEPVLARAAEAAEALGMVLGEGDAGGGSEANLTAPLAPTLDGLGPEGDRAHSTDERVVAASLFQRTALLAALLASETP